MILPDDPFLLQLFESLPGGMILFDRGVAVLSNGAARQILQKDPCGQTLIHLLSNADLETTNRTQATRRTFSLLIAYRWYSLELSELTNNLSLLVFREDNASGSDIRPDLSDSDDLTWLQIIASSISLLSDQYHRFPQEEAAQKMKNYVAMLYKLIGNHTTRSLQHPDDHMPGDSVSFTFQTLLAHIANQLGNTLLAAGLALSFSAPSENHAALLFGHLDHFMSMIYNVLDALIYHHRENQPGADLSPITISEGATETHLFVRFEMPASFRPFPTGLDALYAFSKDHLTAFPPAYIASVKLVIATVRLYKGMLIFNESTTGNELLLCFPKAPLRLSLPFDMEDCRVSPGIEFSDTLGRDAFSKRR